MFRMFLKEKLTSPTSKRNRRVYERFAMFHKHLTMMSKQDILQIKEISSKGFSSNVPERAFIKMEKGDLYSCRIKYLGDIYDIEARVSWKSDDFSVGFELEKADARTLQFLQRLLEPVAIASSLRKVDAEFMREGQLGKTWYHGDGDTDIYTWHNSSRMLIAWRLISKDQFLDWKFESGLKSGRLAVKEESLSGIVGADSSAIQQLEDDRVNEHLKQFGIDILMAADFQDRDVILKTLTESKWD